MNLRRAQSRRQKGPGFTLVELMVGVGLTTVIIFALYNIFNQTQKALRGNVAQVDVMASGRAALELIGRELEQMAPSNARTNLYAGLIPVAPQVMLENDNQTALRTNVLDEIFFLTEMTNHWIGIGYRVIGANQGVGTLCRFSAAATKREMRSRDLLAQFFNEPFTNAVTKSLSTNWARVADGIVHFRLTAYDSAGQRLGYDTTNLPPEYALERLSRSGRLMFSSNGKTISTGPGGSITLRPRVFNVILQEENARQTRLVFLSNAVPASVEIEMGVLEPQTFQQYLAMREGPPQLAFEFLRKQAAHTHLFRKRVPIRSVEPFEPMADRVANIMHPLLP